MSTFPVDCLVLPVTILTVLGVAMRLGVAVVVSVSLADAFARCVVSVEAIIFPLELLEAPGTCCEGSLFSGTWLVELLISVSVISVSGRCMSFPWVKAPDAFALVILCARPLILEVLLVFPLQIAVDTGLLAEEIGLLGVGTG